MKIYKFMFMSAPDADGTGGVEPENGDLGGAVFDAPNGEGTESSLASTPVVPDSAPAPAPFDATAMAKAFGDVLGQHFKPVASESTKLTPEQIKAKLNVWEPTKEWLAKYDNLETREAAIAEQRDGMIRQSDTIAQLRMQEMQGALDAKYAPVLAFMQQQEATARETRFDTAFPVLGKPELKPLIGAVAKSMADRGMTFNDEKSLFEAVAKEVETVIKVGNPAFTISAVGAAKPKSTGRSPNSIPTTSGGGGGGGGGQSQEAPPLKRGLAIFK